MKRKKKVLQLFLASALTCLTWFAVPGMDARAGDDADNNVKADDVTVNQTDFSVSNADGSVTEDVSLTRYSDSWYENNGDDEFKETVDGVKTTYYETAKFKYKDEDKETQTVKVGIGLTSSGDIATVNSDAWAAVDTSVIDNADSMNDKTLESIIGTANCKKSSGCTCASDYDCSNKTCAMGGSDGDLFSGGCIGHDWEVKSVGDIETIVRGNTVMYARPMLVQCEKCKTIETIWLVCTNYNEEEGDPPEEEEDPDPEDGSVTYTAVYPDGTTHGKSTIKVKVTYYPPTPTYSTKTVTATETGGVWTYSDGGWAWVYLSKGDKYTTKELNPESEWDYHENLNRYTVEEKGTKSKSSTLFWAEFIHRYAAGDEVGSTRAINVPAGKTETFLDHTTQPPVGYVFTFDSKPDPSISVPFDVKTPVTAKDKGDMYREGYWTDGWTVNGGMWGFGETRTSLPDGSPMKSCTLTAHWIAEQYTVIFDPNTPSNATHAATATVSSVTATFDQSVTLADASLTGWIFDGWYTAPSGGQQISSGVWTYDPYPTVGNEGSPDTVTLYAHWTPVTYTVVLNGNRPSISIQELKHFTSSQDSFTWAGSTYTATFTYDTPSTLPLVELMYGMQGWTTTDGWYRVGNPREPYVAGIATGYAASYTYMNTSPGMNDEGHGSAKWNLTTENGATVNLYAGWYDDKPDDPATNPRLPDRPTDQRIRLDANGSKWYATATDQELSEDDPYATKTITGSDGYEKSWVSKWINEDVTLDLYTQDYGTGVEKAQLIPTRTPSEKATAAIAEWYDTYGTQSDKIYDLTRVLTYNGTTNP